MGATSCSVNPVANRLIDVQGVNGHWKKPTTNDLLISRDEVAHDHREKRKTG